MRLLTVMLVLAVAACAGPGGTPAPTAASSPLPVVELKFRVFDQVGRPSYCDPDFYPVARADETDLARERLPEMQADDAAFGAILSHNGLTPGVALLDDELLAVYRDWKDLRAFELDATGPPGMFEFGFVVRTAATKDQGERVEGRVDAFGRISVLRREQAGPLMCPICLSVGTWIAAPSGPVRITDLRPGDLVWTVDERGARIAAPVIELGSVEAPSGHEVLRIVVSDGRSVTASPGHPTADGRRIDTLGVGDLLDGSHVVSIGRLSYRGRTYDLLPAGPTGVYWADGVALSSTLKVATARR